MKFNELTKKYVDEETGLESYSKTRLLADVKRFKYDIPYDIFLSNRFVLKKFGVDKQWKEKNQ